MQNYTIALAGNPNVGKSSIFNAMAGMKQHTGNWPGKTVVSSLGNYTFKGSSFELFDLPGIYSINSATAEEEVSRDFICFENADLILIIMDATCIERNLNLALQILQISKNVVVCVNLIDEAKRKKIFIDTDELSLMLGVPVVTTNAKNKIGIENLKDVILNVCSSKQKTFHVQIDYPQKIESAIENLESQIKNRINTSTCKLNTRWISLKLLEQDDDTIKKINNYLKTNLTCPTEVKTFLSKNGCNSENLKDIIAISTAKHAENIFQNCVKINDLSYQKIDRRIDKILTSKATGIPIMIILLGLIFFITIIGANYPSEIISSALFSIEEKLCKLSEYFNIPKFIHGPLITGIYRTLAWVVSVMLPPMAIFFPLFTLLEDLGYIPRIAFNMDNAFKKSGSNGKQCLSMCMGFGCNACGIIGTRIIRSDRERLISILTNNFVPCNGRFPTIISLISIFFVEKFLSPHKEIFSSIILTSVILLSVMITLLVSKFLSCTFLKGFSSSFYLELPPYRKPQICKIIVRSIFDRTLSVLGRAISVAAPAGLILWLISNITVGDKTLLLHFSNLLDPFARTIGLDGTILVAFILGFPANEIVFPIIIMAYLGKDGILELSSLDELKSLLLLNGWTTVTAICTIVFSLFHFPCGTTLLTIKKETNSTKWTTISFILPTLLGIVMCYIISSCSKILNFTR